MNMVFLLFALPEDYWTYRVVWEANGRDSRMFDGEKSTRRGRYYEN